ncbi:hypothetical protein ACVMIH_007529 [Bradyrhizobium sp. USDA 4503]
MVHWRAQWLAGQNVAVSKGGLIVMPHAPNPQAEHAADIVLGLVDAIEMMSASVTSYHAKGITCGRSQSLVG